MEPFVITIPRRGPGAWPAAHAVAPSSSRAPTTGLSPAAPSGVAAPSLGWSIAMAALSRAEHLGADYAVDGAPTSPHAALSHNRRPDETRLEWLRGRYKCNQFVGDALAEAGWAMPTYRMPGGGQHYVNAEALPQHRGHFGRITDSTQLRPGDVVVVDYPGRGANSAHAEVVTDVDPRRGILHTVGAHADGAYPRDWSELLDGATYDPRTQSWKRYDGSRIYLLRAKRPLAAEVAR